MQPDMECTLWPDGWPEWLGGTGMEWHLCCVDHDLGASTWALGECVWQTSPVMASVMVLGLVMFGGIYAYSRKAIARIKQR